MNLSHVREKYGDNPNPLEGVPDEHREEAESILAGWTLPTRGLLRLTASILKLVPPPEWKLGVYRRLFARIALTAPSDRLRLTATLTLGQIDPEFLDETTAFAKARRQSRRACRGR